ncbi:hypothetical protein BAUCODRAFT_58804, partial [Baudoinia panamericana UAMH 10762]
LDWTRHDVPNLSPWIQFAKNFDYSTTQLGPMSAWPEHLRSAVVYSMSNPQPRIVLWGEERTFLYNEACIPLIQPKHPSSFGQPAAEAWADVYEGIGPLIDKAFDGQIMSLERLPVMMTRKDFVEESYFDFSLLPVMGPDGRPCGVLDEVVETTKTVRSERRRQSMLVLTKHIAEASSLDKLWSAFLRGVDAAGHDVPYALLYAVQHRGSRSELADDDPEKCALVGTVGMPLYDGSVLQSFDLHACAEDGSVSAVTKACAEALNTKKEVIMTSKDGSLPSLLKHATPDRSYGGDEIRTAIVTPIISAIGDKRLGVLVFGLNPRTPYDQEYTMWTHLMTDVLTKTATLITMPEEQRRAQKVADEMNDSLVQQLRITTLQAERSEARFQRMAESTPIGMFYFQTNGMPVHVNDAYMEMLGVSGAKDAVRSPTELDWEDKIHPDDLPGVLECWRNIVETKGPATIEYRLKRPWQSVDKATGQVLTGDAWLMANGVPETDSDGNVTAVLGWLTDISLRKFSETLLAQRLEEALENKRQSENFIDMTSHEMRNPLSAILQSADSIVSTLTTSGMPILGESVTLSAETADEIIDAAQTVILCAQHQKRIVDDILTLSKLDAALLVISPDKVAPPGLVTKALKMYESEILRAGIEASMCVEASYNELAIDEVVVDSSRLLQVIINLLTNAIKFTMYSDQRKVRICLGASRERPADKQNGVTYIPERHARQAQMADADWGRGEQLYLQCSVGDTGRGLSEEEMKLLFQRFSQASPKTYKQYGGSGLGLFISRELCELQGGQIGVSSGNGKTTFSFFVKVRRWVAETESEVSAERSRKVRTPSVSATPVMYERRGSTFLSDESSGQSGASAPDENLHVLVVEDNVINQRVMSKQLRRAGCTVHVANHGLECLDFLQTSIFCVDQKATTPTPLSVILLDLEMPTMDGLECIRHIREQQTNGKIRSHVPVIAVTANARSEQISAALAAGMDSVVTKPFRIPELLPQMKAL